MAKRKLSENEMLEKEQKNIEKQNKKPKKVKYILSENVLSLSPYDFDKWLNKSKASQESKARYVRAYNEYQSKTHISKNVDYSEKTQNEYDDKTKSLARKVAYAKMEIKFRILKTNKNFGKNQLYKIFKNLYRYKYNANIMRFIIGFKIIIKGKVSNFIINSNYGGQMENHFAVSSKTTNSKNFNNAFDGVWLKLERVINSQSIDGILTEYETIKFYYKREHMR